MIKTKEKLYFAYGSNMNLNQMAFRCPDAEVVESVRLEGYRLAFRTNGGGNGVATILPEEGSYVDGVLWRISERDEQHLDHYEGFMLPNIKNLPAAEKRKTAAWQITFHTYFFAGGGFEKSRPPLLFLSEGE